VILHAAWAVLVDRALIRAERSRPGAPLREGAEVLIRYTGKQTSKAGRIFKAF